MKIGKVNFTLIMLLLGAMCSPLAAAEVVLVAHPSNSNDSISKSDCGRIFLGRSKAFPDGSTAVAVNQASESQVRLEFDKEYLGKSSSQIKAFWSNQLFTGRGVPPEELSDSSAVVERVAKDASALGYVDSSQVNDSVKVITVN